MPSAMRFCGNITGNDGMTVTYDQLNQGQQEAADAIFAFLNSPHRAFRLSGPPGTGKTYTIRHIADQVVGLYKQGCKALGVTPTDYSVEITATTNKAAEVLSSAFGRPIQTIHGFLNLTVYDDYQSGETKVRETKKWKVHKNTLLFVDEASMIDKALYQFLHKGLDASCKIIFVGDPDQLPPVFESLSKVYAEPKPEAVLSTPVRNANQQALMALCDQFRETVRTGIFKPIQAVPGVIDYLDTNQAFAFVDREFRTSDPSARILCFRNERVKEFNEYIRNLRGHPAFFVPGETVVSNSIVHTADNKVIFRTDQEVYIEKAATTAQMVPIQEGDSTMIAAYKVKASRRPGADEHSLWVPVDRLHFNEVKAFYKRSAFWPAYFKMQNQFPDFRQRDASTVYKAQGSTYESVLLDLDDLGRCYKRDQLARMAYVAVSRPTTRLYLYGSLPPHLF